MAYRRSAIQRTAPTLVLWFLAAASAPGQARYLLKSDASAVASQPLSTAPGRTIMAGGPAATAPATAESAALPSSGEPLLIKGAFHIVGIPSLRRNKKFDLSITNREMIFNEKGERLYRIPFERIERAQTNDEKRDYAKATYAAVVAVGLPGAFLMAKKHKVDALVISYRNERGGLMEMVIEVPKGLGPACLERLAKGGIATGPAEKVPAQPQ